MPLAFVWAALERCILVCKHQDISIAHFSEHKSIRASLSLDERAERVWDGVVWTFAFSSS